MKVTILVDNTRLEGRGDLRSEHGLSLHVRLAGAQILFDTGASDAHARNARRLGIDLAEVDAAMISHHHFDHGGGLPAFFGENRKAKVYLRRWSGGDCVFRSLGFVKSYVGLERGLLDRHAERIELVDEPTEVLPGVVLLTHIPTPFPLPRGNRRLLVRQGAAWKPDPFEHELMLVAREEDGLVLFTGCAHRGIRNMVQATVDRHPGVPIKAVFGGFHLIGLPYLDTLAEKRADVEALAESLAAYPVGRYFAGHCTGAKAYRVLKRVLGSRIDALATGKVVDV